ncbi:MAG TPA: hypothetical protein VNM48_19570, partial [Chloroflexota bacterium]|nr:hypothetical protein [Chloroflexota bacterium]
MAAPFISINTYSNQPLGGTSGDWRPRLLHSHLPLALVSVVVLVLWISLPLFQAAGHQGAPRAAVQAAQAAGHQRPAQAAGHQRPPQAAGHAGPAQAAQTGGASPAMDQSGNHTGNLDGMQNRAFMARF